MEELELLQARGNALRAKFAAMPPLKMLPSCSTRLLKLVRGELNFLARLASSGVSPPADSLASSNFDHLEAVVQLVEHPLVHGICAVMQRFPASVSAAHVDMVGLFEEKPAWFVVSDRNPRHIAWNEAGLQGKTVVLLQAAVADAVVRPACIIFYFAKGLEAGVGSKLENEFHAEKMEENGAFAGDATLASDTFAAGDEWVLVGDETNETSALSNSWINLNIRKDKVMYQIDLEGDVPMFLCKKFTESITKDFSCPNASFSAFYNILEDVNRHWSGFAWDSVEELKLVNLDTTALIGLVSGISNDCAGYLANTPTKKLTSKYSSFAHFFKAQALLELQKPFLKEVAVIFRERQPIVSQFAWNQFQSIVSVVGGPQEQLRATALHECLEPFIVQDTPSDRVLALPTSAKIGDKHKIVFGTGDSLRAPTLTSNVSFVRAATSKGMALAFIEHRPCALCRD